MENYNNQFDSLGETLRICAAKHKSLPEEISQVTTALADMKDFAQAFEQWVDDCSLPEPQFPIFQPPSRGTTAKLRDRLIWRKWPTDLWAVLRQCRQSLLQLEAQNMPFLAKRLEESHRVVESAVLEFLRLADDAKLTIMDDNDMGLFCPEQIDVCDEFSYLGLLCEDISGALSMRASSAPVESECTDQMSTEEPIDESVSPAPIESECTDQVSTEETIEESASPAYRFAQAGEYWIITFGDEGGHYRDINGFKYLHFLIENWVYNGPQCKPIDAREVMRLHRPPPSQDNEIIGEEMFTDSDERYTQGTPVEEKIDKDAIEECREELTRLKEEMNEIQEAVEEAERRGEINLVKQLKARLANRNKEWENVVDYLERSLYRGRSRDLQASPEQKARECVRHAIKRVYGLLEKDMPQFVEYVKEAIPDAQQGAFIYRPGSDVNWVLE